MFNASGKNEIRSHARLLRRELYANRELHARLSLAVQNHILESPQWGRCQYLCLYCAIRGEVLTEKLMREAWKQKKTVLFPLCRPTEIGFMDFARCQGPDDFQDGLFHIPEPRPHCQIFSPAEIARDEHALILVPALVYDHRGFRLGYGRGYYDRFLEHMGRANSVGLTFYEHLISALPADPWDKPVRYLATERGMERPPEQFNAENV